MKRLLIFIPTYNRLSKLRKCVECLLENMDSLEDDVEIHISDNQSVDGTWEYLQALNHCFISYSRNESNVGAARNLLKVFNLSNIAEFTWIIGDDDFVINDGIRRLVKAIIKYPKVDFYFLNTLSFSNNNKPSELHNANISRIDRLLLGGKKHSKIGHDFVCTLQELINPKIDPVFGGAVMCYAFRSRLIKDSISQKIRVSDLSQHETCYPHTLCWLYSLTPSTRSAHLHRPFTYNVWHEGADWGVNGLDLAVTHGLGYVFCEALRLGYIARKRKNEYFRHYIRIAGRSFTKLMNQNAGDFPFSPEIKSKLLSLAMEDVLSRYSRVGRLKRIVKQSLIWTDAFLKRILYR
jgi:glycosyltransferase involved in cell wall biosynthesis